MDVFLFSKFKFRTRVALMLSVFFVTLIGFQSGLFLHIFEQTIVDLVGSKALVQAKEIAADPAVIASLNHADKKQLSDIFSRTNQLSDADYVVIADQQELRLYHPNPDYIGEKITSEDNYDALKLGKSHVFVSKGKSGLSIRGKTPVIADNQIIGVVSVGYLVNKLSHRIFEYSLPILSSVGVAIILTIMGAYFFSNHIKNQMFNMEPGEIAQSLQIKTSIMQTMYEGIVATNNDGSILSINRSALEMLGITHAPETLTGRFLQDFVTPASFFIPCKENEHVADVSDEIMTCNGETFIATRVKMTNDSGILGTVVSLRKRDNITTLTTQLAQVQHYLDNLRVMRHEHNNQLSTISGLLQIGENQKALELLESTNSKRQALIDLVTQIFKPKIIAGLLLGKICRAEELGLTLEIDPMSALVGGDWPIKEDELSALLGNVLDNAFESSIKNPDSNKIISLFMNDSTEELIVQVSDNGIGFQGEDPEDLITRGVSSKKEAGHGIGLYLVNTYIKNAGGTLLIEESEPQGAVFSIYIPKIHREDTSNESV